MKCVYIGDFRQAYSSENYVTYGLQRLGVEVIQWQENKEATLHALFLWVMSQKPDFVLFCKARVWSSGDLLIKELRKARIPTITWLFDLYFDLPREMGTNRTVHDAPFHTDLVLTSDGGHDAQWKKLGINHVTLRQGIHEPEALIGKVIANHPPIVFVGSASYHVRNSMISSLRERYGILFRHYGEGGTGPGIRGLNLNNVFASAKIVIGDSVPSNNYWSNRIYETLGRGGFLLHPKVGGLEKEFQYYKHFIPFNYNKIEELFEIIDYYLVHDKKRKAIQKAGFEFVRDNYTYTIRCKTLIQEAQKNIGIRG